MSIRSPYSRSRQIRCLHLALFTALATSACDPSAPGASAEYEAAMRAYEETITETRDPSYTHASFDRVATLLEQVSADRPGEHALATTLAQEIRAVRARIVTARRDSEAATREPAHPARPVRAPRSDAPRDEPARDVVATAPPSVDLDRAAAFASSDADDARARTGAQAEARRQQITDRMAELTEQKLEARFNEPIGDGNWSCNQITHECRTLVTVTAEEAARVAD